MKTRHGSPAGSPLHQFNIASKRSSALVIVLACVVFISVLIVAFFASVSMDRQSAQFYVNASSVKLLSDSTVSIVMGQIKDATKGVDSGGNILAWASQPGMIRNYNAQGAAAGYYKLYSSTNMVGTSSFPGETPSTTWMNSPAIYTDLNDPITNSSAGFNVYPIVDPAATNFVQGFTLKSAPVSTSDNAPMPVQWLYVLQSGQVINPDSGGNGTKATFLNAATPPSASNPIVGRVAFWTDDDTCKVNINTAAGDVWVNNSSPPAIGAAGNPGSFWDTPRIWSQWEYTNLAVCQPADGEYQRYPGHPATTYLSAVFTNILTTPASVYNLTPRVSLGGSLSGTTYPLASMLASNASSRLYASVDELLCSTNLASANRVVNNAAITPQILEQSKFFLTAHSRAPEVNLYNEPRIVIWPISTNAPPTYATGTYRTGYDNLIAYCGTLNNYPYYFQRTPLPAGGLVNNNAGQNLIGLGSRSPTADLPATASGSPATDISRNRQLITYLRNLTSQPVPGFSTGSGETFLSKYPLDRDQILTEIFDYIRSLNAQDLGTLNNPLANSYTIPVWLASTEGQIMPITDTASNGTTPLRGFGRMAIITEASLLFVGTGQTASSGAPTSVLAGAAVAAGNTRIQAALMLKFFDPSQGYAYYTPKFKVVITGLSGMQWTGTATKSVGFNDPASVTVVANDGLAAGSGNLGVTPFVYGTGYTLAASGCIGQNTLDCVTGGSFSITDTTFTVKIYDPTQTTLLQTYNLEFPAGTFPVPQLAPIVIDYAAGDAASPADFRNLAARFNTGFINYPMMQTFFCGKDVVRSIALVGDPRSVACLSTVPATRFLKVSGYDTLATLQAHGIIDLCNGGFHAFVGTVLGKLVKNTQYSTAGATTPYSPTPGFPADFYYATPTGTSTPAAGPGVQPVACGGCGSLPGTSPTWDGSALSPVPTLAGGIPTFASSVIDPPYFTASGGYAVGANGVTVGSSTLPGDWDNGTGPVPDGAFINKADEGAIPYNNGSYQIPYFGAGYSTFNTTGSILINKGANFSPNRQMPSAGMFGSLPTGVIAGNDWQTLLFRPDPDGLKTHPGAQTPPDYLMLDLFNMPIVEPYAISDPFSTAGKINMNYQIVPFSSYMTRSTGIQAVMRGEQILAVAGTRGTSYKASAEPNRRYYLDLSGDTDTTGTKGTLTGFAKRFATGDIFRSASEICSIWLVPLTLAQTYSTMQAYWLNTTATGGMLTGDNARERPYTNFYPRLTTKSNTFTVHMRVQTLKMVKIVDPTYASWVEGSDVITGEYRGSSTIERYLDTSSTTIPDYATLSQPLTAGQAIDNYYKFRVVETKQFTP